MFKRVGVLKEFGVNNLKVTEEVAKKSSLLRFGKTTIWKPDIFCLRIDADEYSRASFEKYYPLFEKYKDALTIFFNVSSFKDAKEEIIRCRDMGIDVQSHAFYHYTYDDYESNRYNINKAKKFFNDIGIKTEGFVAPLGRWNRSLSRALEDEGYKYSSEFSYDYMAYPSYPLALRKKCNVLQIPVFPVAPELFFEGGKCDRLKVVEYYKSAIDELIKCNIPVIIYAHTSPTMPEIPSILEEICEYALNQRKLKPISMTGYFNMWEDVEDNSAQTENVENKGYIPGEDFLGYRSTRKVTEIIKDITKNVIDFERVTPSEELRCGKVKKMLKLLARKVL